MKNRRNQSIPPAPREPLRPPPSRILLPIIIEDKQTDCGRKIRVLALAAFLVDSRNELAYRNALSISDAFQLIPESGLQAHAGFMAVQADASLENLRFSAWLFGSFGHQRLLRDELFSP